MQNIRIKRMRTRGVMGALKAFFTLAIDTIEVDDMRLLVGTNGPFVGFPSKKIKRGTGEEDWVDLVKLARGEDGKLTDSSKELQLKILDAAIDEYERRMPEDRIDRTVPGTATAGATTTRKVTDEEDDDLPF